ncbi:MAG: 5-formyltetrahydrofolate cyclo-ligase [Thermodesulfobacteriota bacterium]
MPLSSNKAQIRKDMLEMRLGLSRESICRQSLAVERRFLLLDVFKRAGRVALYRSFRGEVLTDDILAAGLSKGKDLYFPKVGCGEMGLDFIRVAGEDDFSTGAFNIDEPDGDNALDDLSMLDLIVVPGVAFDVTGNRLGYGKGYYDMTLRRVNCSIVALAYDFQVVEPIFSEPHDVGVHKIVTEKRIIEVAR